MTQTEVSQDAPAGLDDIIEEASTEGSETEAPAPEGEVAPEADSPVINIDEYGNHMVPIEVDGETVMKPLSEVRSGFMMQSDYTRKTQELATEREKVEAAERLQRHLADNPEQTLRVLANAYEVNLGTPGEPIETEESIEDLDPEEARIARIEASLAERDRQDSIDALNRELVGLTTKYGEFEPNELLQFAVENHMEQAPLETVFRSWKPEAVVQGTAGAEEPPKEDPPPVASGGSVQGGSVETGGSPINTIDDAFEAAARELGLE